MSGSSARQHALAVGLAERNKPHAGGNPVRRKRMQKRVQCRFAGDAVTGTGDADGDRQRDRAGPGLRKTAQARRMATPRALFEKGASLGGRLQKSLFRWHESRGKLGYSAQSHRHRSWIARCA